MYNKTHGVLTDDALRAEAKELSAILAGMGEGGYELETLYSNDQTDGDAFVRRAADLLAVFAAPQSPVAPADERALSDIPSDSIELLERAARARLADAPTASAITPMERAAIVILLKIATTAYHAADDGEDDGGENIHVDRDSMQALSDALDRLDTLPDDQPGYALSGGARAGWALRRLLNAPTVSATLTQLRDAADSLGFALVPLIPTRAMNDVFATEDWRWSDLLAEAEAIDEAQQAFVDENENAAPTPPTSAADIFSPYSYQRLFDAISAATNAQDGGAVNVSVEKFRAAIAASQSEQSQ